MLYTRTTAGVDEEGLLAAVAEAAFGGGVHVLPFDELHERHMSAAFSRRDRPPIL